MTCIRYPDDDVVLRYVAGDLAEPDQTAFEDHLFACDVCLARVERYQAAQQVLSSRERLTTPMPFDPATSTSASRPLRGGAWWMLAAAAALLLAVTAGTALWRSRAGSSPQLAQQQAPAAAPAAASAPARAAEAASTPGTSRALQLAVLAMVTPPPYLAITTRGDADGARFATAMDAYARQDWTGAAESLRGIDTPPARFYGGIAELMRGKPAAAAASFEEVRARGVAPYARESAFYLGKAALQRGNVAEARTWFARTQTEGATTAREATRLLAALDELQGR